MMLVLLLVTALACMASFIGAGWCFATWWSRHPDRP